MALTPPMRAAAADALLTSVLLTVADAAAGTDAVGSITVNVTVSDIGQAVDLLGQIDAVLSVLDLGTGVDVAVQFDSAVKLVKVVFTLARRAMAFVWLARSIEFGGQGGRWSSPSTVNASRARGHMNAFTGTCILQDPLVDSPLRRRCSLRPR